MNDALVVDGVHAGYSRRVAVVHGINLRVMPKQTVALLGPNGSGKSTLLKTVFGLTVLHKGSLTFDGHEISKTPSHRLPGMGMGYVPQQDAVFPGLSVKENLAIGGKGGRRTTSRRMLEMLELLPTLRKRISSKAGSLSGGEQRMLAIGRALMSSPKMLLLDEPTAGLAPMAGAEILEQVDDIRFKLGIGVLLVEQNARAAVEVADHVLVLAAGEVVFSGTHQEAVADAELAELYLGKSR